MKPDTPEIKYVWIDDSQLSYEKMEVLRGQNENTERLSEENN